MLQAMPGDRFEISADAFYDGMYQQDQESAFSGSYAYDLNSGSSFAISGFSSPAGLEVYARATSGNFSYKFRSVIG